MIKDPNESIAMELPGELKPLARRMLVSLEADDAFDVLCAIQELNKSAIASGTVQNFAELCFREALRLGKAKAAKAVAAGFGINTTRRIRIVKRTVAKVIIYKTRIDSGLLEIDLESLQVDESGRFVLPSLDQYADAEGIDLEGEIKWKRESVQNSDPECDHDEDETDYYFDNSDDDNFCIADDVSDQAGGDSEPANPEDDDTDPLEELLDEEGKQNG